MSDHFNLSAPPGFVGCSEHKELRIYHRHLPHWRQDGASYAVTFRLRDALPQSKQQEIKRHRERWEKANPEPRNESLWYSFAKQVNSMTERWLDEGYGACYFRDPTNAALAAGALRFYEDTKCSVPCFTVMPNHVHAIMIPKKGFELEAILQPMKGWLARQVNLRRDDFPVDRQGKPVTNLWEQESYDRIIRDEEHLFRVVQYFGRNGRAAGLKDGEYFRWISPAWVSLGWGFRDE